MGTLWITNEQAQRARLRIGTTLGGKWRLERMLGVGASASVYEAKHSLGKRVAIKILHESPGDSAGTPDASFLKREGAIANRIDHPGVISILDEGVTDKGAPFLVMDLAEGETLATYCKAQGGRLEWKEALAIANELLGILAVAHEKGVLHLDLTPENIFRTPEGRLKVLDFGAAFERKEPGDVDVIAGTPEFMAPEQAEGNRADLDERTDVWGAGAVLYALLSGKSPRSCAGQPVPEQLEQIRSRAVPSIGQVQSELPAPVVALLDRAMAFSRENRFADVRSMQAAVDSSLRSPAKIELNNQSNLEFPSEANFDDEDAMDRTFALGRRTLVVGGALVVSMGIALSMIPVRSSGTSRASEAEKQKTVQAPPAVQAPPVAPAPTPSIAAAPTPSIAAVPTPPPAKTEQTTARPTQKESSKPNLKRRGAPQPAKKSKEDLFQDRE